MVDIKNQIIKNWRIENMDWKSVVVFIIVAVVFFLYC